MKNFGELSENKENNQPQKNLLKKSVDVFLQHSSSMHTGLGIEHGLGLDMPKPRVFEVGQPPMTVGENALGGDAIDVLGREEMDIKLAKKLAEEIKSGQFDQEHPDKEKKKRI